MCYKQEKREERRISIRLLRESFIDYIKEALTFHIGKGEIFCYTKREFFYG